MTVTAENIGDARPVYTQLSRAWHRDVNLRGGDYHDEVMVGFDAPGGGTYGEYGIRWYDEDPAASPMLHVFDDGWSALAHSVPVVERLAGMAEAGLGPYPTLVCDLLSQLGFQDSTAGDASAKDMKDAEDDMAQETRADLAGGVRSYVRRARRSADIVDEVAVTVALQGSSEVEEGTFYFRWHDLTKSVAPRLEARGAGLSALAVCPDLVESLAAIDDTNPAPGEICRMLETLSFTEER